jgi:predicted thioesterase
MNQQVGKTISERNRKERKELTVQILPSPHLISYFETISYSFIGQVLRLLLRSAKDLLSKD